MKTCLDGSLRLYLQQRCLTGHKVRDAYKILIARDTASKAANCMRPLKELEFLQG
jgi:hypothetical protein